MENIDKHIRKLNEALLAELPQQLRLLRWMGRALHYADRNLHSALGFVLGENKASEAQVKYLAAIEAVTLGFEMHNSVGGIAFIIKVDSSPILSLDLPFGHSGK